MGFSNNPLFQAELEENVRPIVKSDIVVVGRVGLQGLGAHVEDPLLICC